MLNVIGCQKNYVHYADKSKQVKSAEDSNSVLVSKSEWMRLKRIEQCVIAHPDCECED